MPDTLDFYAVRNRDGKWFRRKGYGGYGETWVDDVKQARIYTKIGHARSIVSFFVGRWPEFGVPSIHHFVAVEKEIIDEEARIEASRKRQEMAEARAEERRAKRDMAEAKARLESANKRLRGHETA